jgi:hypothetical protein
MRPPIGAAALGFLLAICAFLGWRAYVLTSTDAGFEPPPSTTTTSPRDDSAKYLAAWERSQEADYFVVATSVLENESSSLTSEEIRAHYQGWRLIDFDGTIVFERNGVSETCRETPTEVFCTPPVEAASIDGQRASLEALLQGPMTRYRVTLSDEAGCFDIALDASKGPPDDRFGIDARQCFDLESGALARSRVRKINRTEIYDASEILPEVAPARLRGLFPEPILEEFFNR